ncbi:MAG TPA: glutaredoxin family protein [Lacipirellulaceae bacterium]|jgi:glutaredoxin
MNEQHKTADRERLHIVLYTRASCHLCDDALRLLEAHGLAPECIDVDADPALRERFDACVPVVEIDGQIRFRGRVDAVLLRRLIERRRAGQDSQDS